MRQRCLYPRHASYQKYGAKGITICDEWRDSFSAFLRDMGARPPGKTLDRIDGTKGYFKDNCRWATPKEQAANMVDPTFRVGQRNKTRCPAGHPYAGDNLYTTKTGHRQCKACSRALKTARRQAGLRD